ncbi:hypothetical protein WNZ14_20490 [Hoeflea sp. AS60]|uniref:hypothetical protein n=1 Tax=Hoeflea sp. AS60 TaxID=3135780 RepID=UPI003170A392
MRGTMSARLTSCEIDLAAPSRQAVNRLLALTPAFVSLDILTNGLWRPEQLFASRHGRFRGQSLFLGPARTYGPKRCCAVSIVIDWQCNVLRAYSIDFAADGDGKTVAARLVSTVCYLIGKDRFGRMPNGNINVPLLSDSPFSDQTDVAVLNHPFQTAKDVVDPLSDALMSFGKPVRTMTAAFGLRRDCGAWFQLFEDIERAADIRFWRRISENFKHAETIPSPEPLTFHSRHNEGRARALPVDELEQLLRQALSPGNLGAQAYVFSRLLGGQEMTRRARAWVDNRERYQWLPLVAKVEAMNLLGIAESSSLEELLRLLLAEPLHGEIITPAFFGREDFIHLVFEELVFAQNLVDPASLNDALGKLIAGIDSRYGLEGRAKALSYIVNKLTLAADDQPHHLLPSLPASLRLIASICDHQASRETQKPSAYGRSKLRLVKAAEI